VKETAYEFVVNAIMTTVAGERMTGEQVLRFKEMTEAGFAAAGAANRQDFLPVLRLAAAGLREDGEEARRARQGAPPVRPEPHRRVQAAPPSWRPSAGDAEDGDRRPAPAAAGGLAGAARRRGHPHRLPGES